MQDKPLRVGIIGANYTLHAHRPAWVGLGVEVAAVCTAHRETAEAAAAAYGIPKAYHDYRQMAADPDIDIISVGTKPSLRFDMVMSALEGGKHVYNCLPFATSVADARALRDTQQRKGLVGVADAQFRWVPAIRRMKELIDEGRLGDLYQATIHVQLPLVAYDDFVYPLCTWSEHLSPYTWLGDAASGGSAWRNFASHALLTLTYLFGEIEEIVAHMETFTKEWRTPDGAVVHPDTPDVGMALVRFRNGGMANVNVSWATVDACGFFLEAAGSRGRMVVRDPSFADAFTATLYVADSRNRDFDREVGEVVDLPARLYEAPGTSFGKSNCERFTGTMALFLHDFVQAIREGREASPSFAEACHVHTAVEAGVRSLETRGWMRIDDVE